MQEIFNTIALTQIRNIGVINARLLYEKLGSATAVMEHRSDIKAVIPDATPSLVEALRHTDDAFRKAEKEMEFICGKRIRAICLNNDAYPKRLAGCTDAPVILYYYGNADLNSDKIISIVGTRNCTAYGKEMCSTLVADIKKEFPNAIIVSGLAYGIDVAAHNAALDNGMQTVGVVAHGLEKIYPAAHRDIARKMTDNGGILTEYIHCSRIDRSNFLRRNRIIAGIADACVVVESASHGGSLVTADIANSYSRDVFTFPGKVNDEQSRGCNMLIKENKAMLIESADDMIEAMGWSHPVKKAVQQELFAPQLPPLSDDEQRIVNCISGTDSKSLNLIVNETGISFGIVSSLVFELEAKNIVEMLGGARVRLTNK